MHVAHQLSGAVYGTILATTVVAAAGDPAGNTHATLVIVVVTSFTFWLAHVYSRAVAERIVVRQALGRAEIGRIARGEWPMLQSSVPILIPLVLGWLGVVDEEMAARGAVAVGVVALVLYGLLIGVREGRSRWGVLLSGAITGSFGLVVLLLHILVH
jgi:hypothetical protein